MPRVNRDEVLGLSQRRSRIFGVDFSGAKNSGRKIWSVSGTVMAGAIPC